MRKGREGFLVRKIGLTKFFLIMLNAKILVGNLVSQEVISDSDELCYVDPVGFGLSLVPERFSLSRG